MRPVAWHCATFAALIGCVDPREGVDPGVMVLSEDDAGATGGSMDGTALSAGAPDQSMDGSSPNAGEMPNPFAVIEFIAMHPPTLWMPDESGNGVSHWLTLVGVIGGRLLMIERANETADGEIVEYALEPGEPAGRLVPRRLGPPEVASWPGQWTGLAAQGDTVCAINARDGQIECREGDAAQHVSTLPGAIGLSVGSGEVCALYRLGGGSCFSLVDNTSRTLAFPAPMRAVVHVTDGLCGLTVDGAAWCEGVTHPFGQSGRRYTRIATDGSEICALTEDAEIECVNADGERRNIDLRGRQSDRIVMSAGMVCGGDATGITCVGGDEVWTIDHAIGGGQITTAGRALCVGLSPPACWPLEPGLPGGGEEPAADPAPVSHVGQRAPRSFPLLAHSIAPAPDGSVYFSHDRYSVHRFDPVDGAVTRVLGGTYGLGVTAQGIVGYGGLGEVTDLTVDSGGNLLVAFRRSASSQLIEVTLEGRVREIVPVRQVAIPPDESPSPVDLWAITLYTDPRDPAAPPRLFGIESQTSSVTGRTEGHIVEIDRVTGQVHPFADLGGERPFNYGTALVAHDGMLYLTDEHNYSVRAIDVASAQFGAFVSFDGGANGIPFALTIDPSGGSLLVGTHGVRHHIHRLALPLDPRNQPVPLVGRGVPGQEDDFDQPLRALTLHTPTDVAADEAGTVWIVNSMGGDILRWHPDGAGDLPGGRIEHVVGADVMLDLNLRRPATSAPLTKQQFVGAEPAGIAVTSGGEAILALSARRAIATVRENRVDLLAGSGAYQAPVRLEDVPAGEVEFMAPAGIALGEADGRLLYVADRHAGYVFAVAFDAIADDGRLDRRDAFAWPILGPQLARLGDVPGSTHMCAADSSLCALRTPVAVAVDVDGTLVVADPGAIDPHAGAGSQGRLIRLRGEPGSQEIDLLFGEGGVIDTIAWPALSEFRPHTVAALGDGRWVVGGAHGAEGPPYGLMAPSTPNLCAAAESDRVLIIDPEESTVCALSQHDDTLPACAELPAPLALYQPAGIAATPHGLFVIETALYMCDGTEPPHSMERGALWRIADGAAEKVADGFLYARALAWDASGERLLMGSGTSAHGDAWSMVLGLTVDEDGSVGEPVHVAGLQDWDRAGDFEAADLAVPGPLAWSEALGGLLIGARRPGWPSDMILAADFERRWIDVFASSRRAVRTGFIEPTPLMAPRALAISADGSEVFVGHATGVSAYPTDAGRHPAPRGVWVSANGGVTGLALDSAAQVLYIAKPDGLFALTLRTGRVRRVCDDAQAPEALALVGGSLYIAEAHRDLDGRAVAGALWRHDIASSACDLIEAAVPLACNTPAPHDRIPRSLSADGDGNLYVSDACTVRRLPAGVDDEAVVDPRPAGRVYPAIGEAAPRLGCISGIHVVDHPEGRRLYLVDACTSELKTRDL